jgi:hypothetical protein
MSMNDGLETRSLAATCRGFAFYVADSVSSVHEFTKMIISNKEVMINGND